jgi:hypothetical protein
MLGFEGESVANVDLFTLEQAIQNVNSQELSFFEDEEEVNCWILERTCSKNLVLATVLLLIIYIK